MASTYKAITATAQVNVGQCRLRGIFCSAAASTPTLAVYDSPDADNADPAVLVTFTPVAGTNYLFPSDGIQFSKGIYAVIANTVTVTFIYDA